MPFLQYKTSLFLNTMETFTKIYVLLVCTFKMCLHGKNSFERSKILAGYRSEK